MTVEYSGRGGEAVRRDGRVYDFGGPTSGMRGGRGIDRRVVTRCDGSSV